MKELPQIIHNKINIPQLTNRSFFIMKGHQSISERSNFFILCIIQINVMGKISLKDTSTRAPKDLDKDITKKKTNEKLDELDDLQNLLFAEGKHSVLVILQGMDASGTRYHGQLFRLIRTGIRNLLLLQLCMNC